jgi:murein DD-endopeptidase
LNHQYLLSILFFLVVLSGPITSWAQSRTPLMQSVDIQIPAQPIPVNISGKKHLAYELHITNFRNLDVALTRIELLDADGKNRLADFRNSDLNARLGRPGAPSDLANKRVIGAGMRAVVYLWLALDDSVAEVSQLKHRIEFHIIRPSGNEQGIVEDVMANIRTESPVVLDPPLRSGPWVALYDPHMERGHRTSIYTINGRARIPARFAIDWIRLDHDATHARGNESRIANWHGYGAEVLAVADSIVADAKDDIPEEESISTKSPPIALENASGNYVTLDLGQGRYAFYEHLKHGSIKIKIGDRVKSGQVIGLLGNSGSSSSGPHLHFHVSDANSTLAAEGLPYVFKSFEVLGAFETIGGFATGERWKSLPHETAGARQMELPAANTVVVFHSAEN